MKSRMSAEERREEVLAAATRAFAHGGYAGTTTDTVAKQAGVSQPYVVRIFGSKLELFLTVLSRACERIENTFAEVIAERPFDPTSEADEERIGHSYTALLTDRDLLRVMMHGFSAAGSEEAIGRVARDGLSRIFQTIRTTGWDDAQVRDFIAHGMLLNVLLATDALTDPETAALADLVTVCLLEDPRET